MSASAEPFNYDGRRFRAVQHSANGDVSASTEFVYRQRGGIVWATYEGGGVAFGTLVATVGEGGTLDMRYHHVDAAGELRTGVCVTTPEVLTDGRLRLHERWRWTSGDQSEGRSTLEEIQP